MNPIPLPRYEDGPTACAAHPLVIRNIAQQIRRSGAVSGHELRVARRMGMVAAQPISRLGFNDGLIYPFDPPLPGLTPAGPTGVAARAAGSPLRARLAPPRPQKRKMHALALLVDFSDLRGQRPAAEFQRLLFDKNNPDSMTSFYRQMSYGALEVDGEVLGWLRAPQSYRYYTAGESGTGATFPQNTPGLLQDALTVLCQQDTLTRFDTDGDGFVDGIFLIHAGGGAEAEPNRTKRRNMIWSHKWTLPQPFINQGVKVFAYSTEPEDGRVGVFSHEFGHVLGLPDLYDTTYRSHGVGDWCLMGGGSWGGQGNRPTRMSCWCLAEMGWIKPRVVRVREQLRLGPLANKKTECCRLWSRGRASSEYFLIENRQATGLDASLPGSGLAVWHVDERSSNNDNPVAYRVALVQADGKKDLELLQNTGDDGDLFPGTHQVTALNDTTTPSTRANLGQPTRVALSNIAATPAGEITLTVAV